MLFYTGLFFLVVAVSLDGFGVGITYGMRRIHVPLTALAIIMGCSAIVVFLSMVIGNVLSTVITAADAKRFGGFILIGLGLFSLWQTRRAPEETNQPTPTTSEANQTFTELKHVLITPSDADLDYSGVISPHEACLLGFALALDALGAGLSAALLGYTPLLTTTLIAFMSGFFVFAGIQLGLFLSTKQTLRRLKFIPPLLLIFLGFYNLL